MTHSFPTRRLSDLQAHVELPCTAFVLVGDPSECVVPDESIDELRRRLRGLDGTRHSAVSAAQAIRHLDVAHVRSEEHTSELQSLMRISYAVFCLKQQNKK